MAQISLQVAALQGSGWQVDMHMYYFAMLALIGVYCDAAAVVAAAGVVAVQHIGSNFVLPAALYPGGGDLGRVALHAWVLILESAGLIFMGVVISRAFANAETALAKAAQAQAQAEAAVREADALRAIRARQRRGAPGPAGRAPCRSRCAWPICWAQSWRASRRAISRRG